MNAHDLIDSLTLSSLFLPYWKAAGKYLVSKSASLSLGLVAFLISQTLKGEAAMNKPTFDDYVIAHPIAAPLWVSWFVYLFLNLSPQGFLSSLVVLLFFLFWLRQWLQSLVAILERQSAEPVAQEAKAALPCIEPAKT